MALIPFDPPPGVFTDDTTFSMRGRWSSAAGMRFYRGKAETIGGSSSLSSGTTPAKVKKLLAFEYSSAIRVASAGTLLLRHELNVGSTDITPASNWNADARYCLHMFGDVLLALVSGGRLFESAGGVQATAVTNAPTQSTAMVVTPSRQIMLGGTQEEGSGTFNGRCLRWCNIEDRTDWASLTSNNAGEYILPGQEDIVSLCVVGDTVLVWTEGSLWSAHYIGDPLQTFAFTRVASVGLIALDAFAVLDDIVYWISPDFTFHSYMIGAAVQPIHCPISREFTDALDVADKANATVVANRRFGEIWFFFPRSTAPNGFPNNALIYAVRESIAAQSPIWSSSSANSIAGAAELGAIIDSSLLAALGATAGANTAILGVPYSTAANVALRWIDRQDGTSAGTASVVADGLYMEESGRAMMVKRFIPDFEVQSGNIDMLISARRYPHDAQSGSTSATISTTDKKKDFRKTGKIFKVTLAPASTSVRLRLGKSLFEAVPMGER